MANSIEFTAANPGIDGNRIAISLVMVYGGGGASVSVVTSGPNVAITVTVEFADISGMNVDWSSVASAVNGAAGAYVNAVGQSGDTSVITMTGALQGGSANGGLGVYYSGSVMLRRLRVPRYVRRYTFPGF